MTNLIPSIESILAKGSKTRLNHISFKRKRIQGKHKAGLRGGIENFNKRIKRKKRGHKSRVPKQYKIYIESIHWIRRKNLYYQSNPRICAVCGSTNHIQLHHMIYANYGSEKDEHLIPLCHAHHEQFHSELGGSRGNMLKATNEFIQRKQEEIEALELGKWI